MDPATLRTDRPITQPQFRRWLRSTPETQRKHSELLNGQVVSEPPAGWPHGAIEIRLGTILNDHVERNRLGIVMGSSAGIELPSGDTVEPDLSYISAHRLRSGPKPERASFVQIVPDLVVEIRSPSTARRDRTEKRKIYQRNEVPEYWIVDPDKNHALVFELCGTKYRRPRTYRSRLRSRVLPELSVDLKALFNLPI